MITIRKIRLERGMTQKELARCLNVTPNAVTQWEKGTRNPSLNNVKKMAEILHCTTDEILGSVGGESDES
jgi:transcriptional regulator with XRE-family HTH domain